MTLAKISFFLLVLPVIFGIPDEDIKSFPDLTTKLLPARKMCEAASRSGYSMEECLRFRKYLKPPGFRRSLTLIFLECKIRPHEVFTEKDCQKTCEEYVSNFVEVTAPSYKPEIVGLQAMRIKGTSIDGIDPAKYFRSVRRLRKRCNKPDCVCKPGYYKHKSNWCVQAEFCDITHGGFENFGDRAIQVNSGLRKDFLGNFVRNLNK